MKFHLTAICFALHFVSVPGLFAYSENGHRTVGAMADRLIAATPAAAEVKKLLGNITLERAATLPDELRGEDRAAGTFKLPENPPLEAAMLAFRAANPPSYDDLTRIPPSHHWFHYTDVPLQATSYSEAKVGTSKWDVVHMITYCARVLEGKEKPDNDLKITPPVALVLLSHFVGDIHQPLHVGAVYLNAQGDRIDPDSDASALESRGGNDINFGATNLHAYWDYDAVESSLSFHRRMLGKMAEQYGPSDLAADLLKKEPAHWKPDPSLPVEAWSEKWADEIMPLAREAHDRLRILPQQAFDKGRDGKPMLRWTAIETPHMGQDSYSVFASKAVEKELSKGGFRLADMIETVLTPGAK